MDKYVYVVRTSTRQNVIMSLLVVAHNMDMQEEYVPDAFAPSSFLHSSTQK
jgi:hypothetical protein